MTKDELKEAISETIYSNGKKGITGDSLAILLNHIIDAAGEGGGSGGDIYIPLHLDDMDENGNYLPNEQRAEIYTRIVDGINNGVFYNIKLYGQDEMGTMAYTVTDLTYDIENNIIALGIYVGIYAQVILYPDGSMTLN